MASAIAARIQINGRKFADLYNGGFVYTNHVADEVFIMLDASLDPGEWQGAFKLEAGKDHYFFVTPNSNKVMAGAMFVVLGAAVTKGGPFIVYPIPEDMALERLKTMKLIASLLSSLKYILHHLKNFCRLLLASFLKIRKWLQKCIADSDPFIK
jgi:hypothetical protein